MATGWLGWSPRDAWHTPIPEIVLALEARVDWIRRTTPGIDPEPPAEPGKENKPDVAEKLRQALMSLRDSDER